MAGKYKLAASDKLCSYSVDFRDFTEAPDFRSILETDNQKVWPGRGIEIIEKVVLVGRLIRIGLGAVHP